MKTTHVIVALSQGNLLEDIYFPKIVILIILLVFNSCIIIYIYSLLLYQLIYLKFYNIFLKIKIKLNIKYLSNILIIII